MSGGFRAARSFARLYLVCASSSDTLLRSESAFALVRFARACSTCVWNSDGSSLATTWPLCTIELKSAPRYWMVPDTWLPTCTVVTAWRVPVAPTVSMMSPRVTGDVLIFGVGLRPRQVRAGLLDLRLEQRRFQPCDDLALVHDRIEVGAQVLDGPRHLAADLHRRDGLEGPRGAHRIDDVAARHW